MCSKLLASVMPDLLAALERHGELQVVPEVRALLLQVSPSTIDRLLRKARMAGLRQPRRQRLATTGLKAHLSEWKDAQPGRCRRTWCSTAATVRMASS